MKRLLSFFAILALSMHLMAGISPLWMPKAGENTIQICTTQGIETVTLDENGQAQKSTPVQKSSHACPFCLAHCASALTPKISATAVSVVLFGSENRPLLSSQSLFSLKKKSHPVRGPPLILS